jgi:hypothetical protein
MMWFFLSWGIDYQQKVRKQNLEESLLGLMTTLFPTVRVPKVPQTPENPRILDLPKIDWFLESPFIPQIFPATSTSKLYHDNLSALIYDSLPSFFTLTDQTWLPASVYLFIVWGIFCLFRDGEEYLVCGRFGCNWAVWYRGGNYSE